MAQRYFIDMTHWVRLPDGRVVIFTRSERMEELKPYSPKEDKKKGMIRGEIHFAGFVLESRGPTGCLVTHILKVFIVTNIIHDRLESVEISKDR
jgi:hypothetical protein